MDTASALFGQGGAPHHVRAQQASGLVDERGHPEEVIDRDGVVLGCGEHPIDV